ncbi:hypothetical protein K227x_41720 [Rubripirellula lacrimiformis]|uniref:DUF1559 domain-containing protein n=1 Tax=Rubripirellula lacrimiformis TaxID=1930273 RepID=A0A517NFD3_9BACT|nr:DUF1559 domain-containing protein [Rubripirellula lacrimiformis]QDT05768.1 hypothetical protein K227x_41720 [Rubripirellula lacrimiformis]
MRSSTRLAGYTLVELLVVIAIIGILVSISVPAVMEARRTMARAQCAENLRQLSLATIGFESTAGHMPGYLQQFGEFAGGTDPSDFSNYGGNVPPHIKIGGWPIAIMGSLGYQPAYERWSLDRYPIIANHQSSVTPTEDGYHAYAATNIESFICPSASNYLATRGINHYIANTGMHVDSFPMTYTRPGQASRSVDFLKSSNRSNGIFNNQYAGFDAAAPTTQIPTGKRFHSDHCKDGTSQTMLLSENNQAQATYRTRLANDTSHLTSIATIGGNRWVAYPPKSRYAQGAVFHFEDPHAFAGAAPVDPIHKINGGDVYIDVMTNANASDLARPSSLHTGGVNMAMVDGSVRFVGNWIDYQTYQALLTPAGRNSDMPNNEFIPVDLP